jgi:cell division protein FtsN
VVQKDYKRSRARQEPFSGWTGLALGLAAGLAVGLSVYLFDRHESAPAPAKPKPAPMSAREGDAGPRPEDRYDYYNMLPNFEVVVPEKERAVRPDKPAAPVERPGSYFLQAGSYRDFTEADRIRAQLALQGIESKVQRVSVDNDTWHRVRIGPITDLGELNRIRERLREADMDVLVIRVGN